MRTLSTIAIAATLATMTAIPAFATNPAPHNQIVSYEEGPGVGVGVNGTVTINPGDNDPTGSGQIFILAGTNAGKVGSITMKLINPVPAGQTVPVAPNCVFGASGDFANAATWAFPSQFSQVGKSTDGTQTLTMEWETGAPLVAGQTYVIGRVCSYKTTQH